MMREFEAASREHSRNNSNRFGTENNGLPSKQRGRSSGERGAKSSVTKDGNEDESAYTDLF